MDKNGKNPLQRPSHPLQCRGHKHSPLYMLQKTMQQNHVNINNFRYSIQKKVTVYIQQNIGQQQQ